MKKILVLAFLLLLLTGCEDTNTNTTGDLPKIKTKMELVCVGDFSEDLNGAGKMFQKFELQFDKKGVNYLGGTLYIDVEIDEENLTDNYMESLKKHLDKQICNVENSKYDSCNIQIEDNIAHIKVTGNKEALTGFTNDEDIDLVKKSFEENNYSCLIR